MTEVTEPVRPLTLQGLIDALVDLRDEQDPIEAAKRCPSLQKAAQGILARERALLMERALDLPRMTKAELARRLGVNESKIYRKRADHLPVTPS